VNRGLLLFVVVLACIAIACTDDPEPLAPSYEEAATHPIFDITLDGAEPGSMSGRSGSGDPSGNTMTSARRSWTVNDGRPYDVLLQAVDETVDLGGILTGLSCHEDEGVLYYAASSSLDTDDGPQRVEIDLQLELEEDQPEILISLEVDGTEPPGAPAPGEAVIDGDCPPELLAPLNQ
jgi:hypothetical protein